MPETKSTCCDCGTGCGVIIEHENGMLRAMRWVGETRPTGSKTRGRIILSCNCLVASTRRAA